MALATHKKFTLEEYHRLIEIRFFHEDDRIELIRGEIIEMVSKGTLHVFCCQNLLKNIVPLIGDEAILRCQDPITLPNHSEPEPDFTIARNCEDDYLSHHPYPEDILLVIEIADSSLDYDRQVKLPLYAEAGIEEYWIFTRSPVRSLSTTLSKKKWWLRLQSATNIFARCNCRLPIFL